MRRVVTDRARDATSAPRRCSDRAVKGVTAAPRCHSDSAKGVTAAPRHHSDRAIGITAPPAQARDVRTIAPRSHTITPARKLCTKLGQRAQRRLWRPAQHKLRQASSGAPHLHLPTPLQQGCGTGTSSVHSPAPDTAHIRTKPTFGQNPHKSPYLERRFGGELGLPVVGDVIQLLLHGGFQRGERLHVLVQARHLLPGRPRPLLLVPSDRIQPPLHLPLDALLRLPPAVHQQPVLSRWYKGAVTPVQWRRSWRMRPPGQKRKPVLSRRYGTTALSCRYNSAAVGEVCMQVQWRFHPGTITPQSTIAGAVMQV